MLATYLPACLLAWTQIMKRAVVEMDGSNDTFFFFFMVTSRTQYQDWSYILFAPVGCGWCGASCLAFLVHCSSRSGAMINGIFAMLVVAFFIFSGWFNSLQDLCASFTTRR